MREDFDIQACSELLGQLADDYKIILVKKCAEERGGISEIDSQTLISVDRRLKDRMAKSSAWSKTYVSLISVCFFVSLSSLFYLISVKNDAFRYIVHEIDRDSRFLVVCFLCSYTIFLIFYLSLTILRIKAKHANSKSIFYLEYEIVSEWREFEHCCRRFNVLNKFGDNISPISIMKKTGIFDKSDIHRMRRALRMRNEIIHSNGHIYQERALKESLSFLKESIRRMDSNM